MSTIPVYGGWFRTPAACPNCGREPENLERVYREAAARVGPDKRNPIIERYHHAGGKVCQFHSEQGRPIWEKRRD